VAPSSQELLRSLPSVTSLLAHDEVAEWLGGIPRATVLAALRDAVEAARQRILAGTQADPVDVHDLLALAESEITRREIPSLRRVINATGIVLHTGLGRAPLSDAAIEAIAEGASGYSNLEYDLATGQRGRRVDHIIEKLVELTGAEAATVVNNNAAATLLILQTLACDRDVLVSRGELIEIGGSYRLPDIMRAGGARLREVGTTNRTRASDYEKAITDETAILLHVHTSNYRVVGFTESVGIAQLVEIAHRHHRLAVDDLGSGALFDLTSLGLPPEPNARDSITAGADLVCFSGDKLLGGPQCGIIVGRGDLIERIEASPLMRTYRVDKLVLLALEATLAAYIEPEEAVETIPTLSMLRESTKLLAERARHLAERLHDELPDESFMVCSGVGFAGGGSMPQQALESVIVQWRPSGMSVAAASAALRAAEVPVVASIHDGAICLDVRTIRESDFDTLVTSITSAVWDCGHDDNTDGSIRLPVL